MRQFSLSLPMPPSVNRVTARLGNSSSIVKRWRKDANNIVLSQGRLPAKMDGPFHIGIVWDQSYKGKRDIDNSIKPLLDYLQEIDLINNDRECMSLKVQWGPAPEGCLIFVSEAV